MTIVYAVLMGGLFGYVLQRIGAADPDKILKMLNLEDLHLMKMILFAIGFSSLLLFAGLAMGLIDSTHLSVKGMYVGVAAGGAILGLGWAIAGFCPGTGVVALGSGRKDAVFFVLGGLVGAALYMWLYQYISAASWMQPVWGGKVTLAQTGEYQALLDAPGIVIAGVLGVLMMVIAFVLPASLRTR